jgi:hypothetical protein
VSAAWLFFENLMTVIKKAASAALRGKGLAVNNAG